MDYKELIDNAIDNISDFFKSEFNYDCKSEFSKKIDEYEIIIKNDKFDYRSAFVDIKDKTITLNEYYNKDIELLLFSITHELLHILSEKDDISKKFVEEGIVQLLTYKILCNKVSEKTLLKAYEQDGYRVPVSIMDTVYLMNKDYILKYIKSNDGYYQLLLSVINVPSIASAILTKSLKCTDLAESEKEEMLKILDNYNYDYSDLCCNNVLIEKLKKSNFSEDELKKMPLILQNETNNYQKREKEKEKIYQVFSNNGLDGLSNISYNFGTIDKYNDGDDPWEFLFNVADQIDESDNHMLFKHAIHSKFLGVALPIIYKNKDVDIGYNLVALLGINNASMLDFYRKATKFPVHNIELDEKGISELLSTFLKNELLTDAIIEKETGTEEQNLLKLITNTFEKYGIVDYYVLSNLFKHYKNQIQDYNEYKNICDKILKRFELDEPNYFADPNSVWFQGKRITSNNYLQYLSLFDQEQFYLTSDTNYILQYINYFALMQYERDVDSILSIINDWITDDEFFNWSNINFVNNYKRLIEYESGNNGYIMNSGKGQFEMLLKTIKLFRKKSLQQTDTLNRNL